jgi:hypothetical protein
MARLGASMIGIDVRGFVTQKNPARFQAPGFLSDQSVRPLSIHDHCVEEGAIGS